MKQNLNVTILNALLYEEKNKNGEKTGKQKIRMDYIILGKESYQEGTKFHGYSVLNCYVENKDNIFDKLNAKVIMQPVELELEQVPSARDPFKTYVRVNCIHAKDEVINLL